MTRPLRYLSVCSGIEAASCAWEGLGWKAVGFSEIEKFPCQVLAARFPGVPNFGDMTRYAEWPIEPGSVDVVSGGTPCQAFSVAGLRKGIDDPRGNLALVYLGLVDRIRPTWVVWENVPGVLSSNCGRDFGSFLGGLADIGYQFAYRVLDAQFWGVAQRRRRVFVVGHIGDWRRAAAILFDRPGGERNYPARVTPGAPPSGDTQGGLGIFGVHSPLTTRPYSDRGDKPEDLIACTLSGNYKADRGDVSQNLIVMAHGQGGAEVRSNFCPTLTCNHEAPIISRTLTARYDSTEDGTGRGLELLPVRGGVRRLTPLECERLQGFPDNWTLIPRSSGKMATDGPRYKAIGNSMAVPVIRWIGERIAQVEATL